MYTRGEGGGLGLWWFEGGEGVPTNLSNHLFLRRGQRMQIVPIHHWHAKNRIPRIPLHFVSGPQTSIVAALDGGRSNIAVCRRYTPLELVHKCNKSSLLMASGILFLSLYQTYAAMLQMSISYVMNPSFLCLLPPNPFVNKSTYVEYQIYNIVRFTMHHVVIYCIIQKNM